MTPRPTQPSRPKRAAPYRGRSKPTAGPQPQRSPRPTRSKKTTAPPGEAHGVRLHKLLSEVGVASRRHSEALITGGHVTVNGKLVTELPVWVDPTTDRITVDGRPVVTPRTGTEPKWTYVAVNKPRNVVSTSRDPEGRRCVTELVDMRERLYPVGRLDTDSSGLILLTNDGELAHRLTHPSYEVPKQYQVSVRGHVTQENLRVLQEGLYLAHVKRPSTPGKPVKKVTAKPASMAQVTLVGYSRDRTRGDRTNLAVTLREGQNREIRRLLARLGYKVRRLQRVAIGPITVKGLGVGQWRILTSREIAMLRKTAGVVQGDAPVRGKQGKTPREGARPSERDSKSPYRGRAVS